ncbi:N-methyl-L-tryptophan oxidase [Pseudonocardia nantongensis]|uniref:N-methyl-L-tryptophan oxidase n=1 Tax=Pseudonocardia nantongensis TaxID=1181885 RepID=UPI00397D8006
MSADRPRDADVAVVGLGTMGSMAAWRLAEAGADVIGFEQYGVAHDRGAAGGESRLFRAAYHEGSEYVPMLRRAREMWVELTRTSGRPLFTPTGCLSIGLPDTEPMRNVRASVEEHGLEHETLDPDALAHRFPQHAPAAGEIGILDTAGGMLRPELAVLTAAERARAAGARLLERTPVLALEPENDGVTVVTAERTWRARRAVVTTGPWVRELVPSAEVTPKPIVLTWFAPIDARAYRPEVFPAFIRDTDGHHLFGCPVMDGVSVKAGVADVWPPLPDARALTRDLPENALAPVTHSVERFLPGLHPSPIRHEVHLDGYTTDRTALVGPVPGTPQVIVLCGFSGHGFKMAPVFGSIAADLALHGGTGFDIVRMDPARFTPGAGAARPAAPVPPKR